MAVSQIGSTPYFLALPKEIRDIIYEYVCITAHLRRNTGRTHLLRGVCIPCCLNINQQIRSEARSIFHREVPLQPRVFLDYRGMHDELATVPLDLRKSIRKVNFTFYPHVESLGGKSDEKNGYTVPKLIPRDDYPVAPKLSIVDLLPNLTKVMCHFVLAIDGLSVNPDHYEVLGGSQIIDYIYGKELRPLSGGLKHVQLVPYNRYRCKDEAQPSGIRINLKGQLLPLLCMDNYWLEPVDYASVFEAIKVRLDKDHADRLSEKQARMRAKIEWNMECLERFTRSSAGW